ncbi:hypothetical protein GCM10014719_06720 [Planomonospora parontospora subsp. antibiotica]|nr:hypothetical protein GCM10014719_06720 [Planomonospora parontospora subsp. antibiotica]GII14112.1 hypothetical protein Ppa05_08380 [Planomonospora parontospora subsp. antibiotica]
MPARLETADDPRRDRYLRLLAVINGWPAPESLTPVSDWFARALRVRLPGNTPDTSASRRARERR